MASPHPRTTLLLLLLPTVVAAQNLETDTARLLPAGWWKIGNAFEYQTSSEGKEAAMPFAVEYGLTDNLELLIEPVPYTAIRPKVGRRATGIGDVEATLTGRFRQETPGGPALAAAAEVKVPTARDSLIGSGEPDYTGYLIASKRFGRWDTHVNVAYTIVGSPPGIRLNNRVCFAVAGVYRPNPRLQLFGEVLGNTAATAHAESAAVPEATGGELVGTVGAGRQVGGLLLYFAVSYDNNNALLLRPGVTLRFR